jgi:putative DNA primase/helicase
MPPTINPSLPDPALAAILQHGAAQDAAEKDATFPDKEAEAIAQIDRIAALATLSPIEYDRIREKAAKELQIRVATLDGEVAKVRPHTDSEQGSGSALLFDEPAPWPDAVNGPVLLADLTAHLKTYMVQPEPAYLMTALWVLFAHTIDAFGVSPILAITSPERGCGKTTLLTLLDGLVPRPFSAVNISTSATFRAIEKWKPTLLIDEADSFLKDNEPLRGVLNGGHVRSNAFVVRVEGDAHELHTYRTWGAKAIAMIGRLPLTLADRSIPIVLRRKRPDEKVTRLRLERCRPLCLELKRRCIRWATDHLEELRRAEPPIPVTLHNRAADNARPLLAIADAIGRDWPSQARQAFEDLSATGAGEDTAGVELLGDLRAIFESRQVDRLASAEIVAALGAMEERPWSEWKNGKPITQRQMASHLSPFGIGSKTIRLSPTETAKGYELEQFSDAFSRYIPVQSVTASQPRNDAASSDFRSVTDGQGVTDRNPHNPMTNQACDAVTDLQGEIQYEEIDLVD